jgi:hypothetical protein
MQNRIPPLCHLLLRRCVHIQEKSKPLPKLLFDSIRHIIIVQFSVKRFDDMVGIESFLLPRPDLSEQLPRPPVRVVDMRSDRGIQILVLMASVDYPTNAVNFHLI